MKKLIIAGGSGFLGQALVAYFKEKFDEIVILSRHKNVMEGHIKYRMWDAANFGEWCADLEGATAVINLCGKSVDCRYTKKNKEEILSSRLRSTQVIGEAILKCKVPPALWINGASATIYRPSEKTPMTEKTGEPGWGFSVEVCKAWEAMFDRFVFPVTRKANLRIALVLGNGGGVFPVLFGLAKKGLGGTMGNGRQMVSWLHVEDFCRIVEWLLVTPTATGVFNASAPGPLANKELMLLLRQKARMMIGLPAPKLLLEIGAFF